MEWYEYICPPININPDKMIKKYNVWDMKNYGYIYAETHKGMYGLP